MIPGPLTYRGFQETGPWPGKGDRFWLVLIWKIFILVTEMKERPAAHKNARKKPAQPKTLGTSVSAKFKSVNKHGTTYSCIDRTLSVVSYRCHAATAEWLSSAVENTAGQTQCCNPVLFIAKAILSLPKFEAKEADAFKPK